MVYLEKFTGWGNKISENHRDIHLICENYGIKNYTINSDGLVDVGGYVNLSQCRMSEIPIKFGRVSGDFYCDYNRLTTLDGSPSYVGGIFVCRGNGLTTLEGGPIEVEGDFHCDCNKLSSLKGCPQSVGGLFNFNDNNIVTMDYFTEGVSAIWCSSNPIQEIYRVFKNTKLFIDSLDWNYMRGDEIFKSRFVEACEEAGVRVPNRIRGYEYI